MYAVLHQSLKIPVCWLLGFTDAILDKSTLIISVKPILTLWEFYPEISKMTE